MLFVAATSLRIACPSLKVRFLNLKIEIGSADFDPCWEQLANAPLESMNILSQPPNVAPSTSLGQRKYESNDIIDDSGDETVDEDWKTLGAAGLLSQYGLKSDAEVVAVKTVKGQSSKSGAKDESVPRKVTKPKSHKRKDQSDLDLAPWAVRLQNIPNDGQLRSKYPFISSLMILVIEALDSGVDVSI